MLGCLSIENLHSVYSKQLGVSGPEFLGNLCAVTVCKQKTLVSFYIVLGEAIDFSVRYDC